MAFPGGIKRKEIPDMIERQNPGHETKQEELKASPKCSCSCGCPCGCPSGDFATELALNYPNEVAGDYSGNRDIQPGGG